MLEAYLHDINNKYQALCVTETLKLSKTKADLVCLKGYHLAASFHRDNYKGGGVCIILDDNIEQIEEKNIIDMSIEYIIEICAVELLNFDTLLYIGVVEKQIFFTDN